MACFHPIMGFQGKDGKVRPKDYSGKPMTIACGQCSGCRLERSRQWAVRIMHEASMHSHNSFITLTYDDKHLPEDKSVDVTHFQKFMKRLRLDVAPRPIRFYHCGEYGDNEGSTELGRPHYHAAIFGWDFPAKTTWKDRNGFQTYRSEQLERLWPLGISEIGTLTKESAAYIARYIMGKVNGRRQDNYYLDIETGVIRKPPYTTMSTRPGIGKSWIDAYMPEVYPLDHVIVDGKEARPPRYYDAQYEKHDPEGYGALKLKREETGRTHKADNTPERLAVKEEYSKRKTVTLAREL